MRLIRSGSDGPPRQTPRLKAIEKEKAAYILLRCGHYTTREEIEFYSLWQPKGKYWCGICEGWTPRRPRPRPDKPESTEPMF